MKSYTVINKETLPSVQQLILGNNFLFSAFFRTAKQVRNSVIDAISIQQRYAKPKKENPTSQHSALLGNG